MTAGSSWNESLCGFGRQMTEQSGGPSETDRSRYRYFGIGPEGSYSPWDHWTFRVRANWEFQTRNAVQGNNLWFIVHYAG